MWAAAEAAGDPAIQARTQRVCVMPACLRSVLISAVYLHFDTIQFNHVFFFFFLTRTV